MTDRSPPGAAPLDDTSGLIPRHVTTKAELDELEFANINQAAEKYFLGRLTDKKARFDVGWLLQVHREMYGAVWRWAGKPRTTELNIGAPPHQILEQLKQLTDNFHYWEKETAMEIVEKAARLHHGLVKIHPFRNGNGRWARFLANLYLKKCAGILIQWPEPTLQAESPFRKAYIESLQQADRGDYGPLIGLHHQLATKIT